MAIVTAKLREGTVAEIEARQFSWRADEPPAAKGTDTGPTPYEMLLGSLAACTAITLRLYADHKGIELSGVDVALEFDRVHAADCEDCDERADGFIERIQSKVIFQGAFDDAQKKTPESGRREMPGSQNPRKRRPHQRLSGVSIARQLFAIRTAESR